MPKGVYLRKSRTEKQKIRDKNHAINRKGIAPYCMTDEIKKKISKGLLGNIPVNKGVQREDILIRIQEFKSGKKIECQKHGFHEKWSLHRKENNLKCNLCTSERNKETRKKDPLKYIFADAKKHAKNSKRNFNIVLQDLYDLIELQKNKCALSNIEFSEEVKPSLDRIDSSKGYEKENIQLLTIFINRMKSNLDQDFFIDLCKKVSINEAGVSRKKK